MSSQIVLSGGKPRVSIIMPSLNVGRYITQCLTSVVAQTLRDIEILCVDAGSTDGTLETIEAFATRDARIRIIRSPVKSYGAQINQGLDSATGDYIGIVDTDDWVEPDMFASLIETADRYNCDIVKSDHFLEYGTYSENAVLIPYDENLYMRVLSPVKEWRIFRFQLLNVTGIFRRSMLERFKVRCNETPGASFQDNGFWFSSHAVAERFIAIPKAFYHYRLNNPNQSVANIDEKSHCVWDELAFIRAFLERVNLFHVFWETYYTAVVASALWLAYKVGPEKRLEVYQRIRQICFQTLGLQHGIPKEHFLLIRLVKWELDDLLPLLDASTADAFVLARFGHTWGEWKEEARNTYVKRFAEKLSGSLNDRLNSLLDVLCHVDLVHEQRALDFLRRVTPRLPRRKGTILRIGFYCHSSCRTRSEIEEILASLIKPLYEKGYELVLIGEDPLDLDSNLLQSHLIQVSLSSKARYSDGTVDLEARIRYWGALIQRHQLDAVCYLGREFPLRTADLLTLRILGVATILYNHNGFDSIPSQETDGLLFCNEIFQLADVVACASRGEAVYWEACGLQSVYVPCRQFSFVTPIPSTQRKTVLWIGQMDYHSSNPIDALKAIDFVRQKIPDVVLTFLGNGSEMETLRSFCRERGFTGNVRFVNSSKNVTSYFDGVRVHLSTVGNTSRDMALKKARAKGIPTVMYEFPGSERSCHREGTIAVPMGDYQALADALITVLTDDNVYHHLRNACIQTSDTITEDDVFQAWQCVLDNFKRGVWSQREVIPRGDVEEMVSLLRTEMRHLLIARKPVDGLMQSEAFQNNSEELDAYRNLSRHRIVRAAIDFDTWTRRAFPPGNTLPRRVAKRIWALVVWTRSCFGRIAKQFVPYGLMRVWLKARYGMVIDEPLMAYPGFFKRVKRVVKFSLPYGLVEAWKHADVATQVNGGSGIVSVFRRILRPRGK